MTQPTQRYKRTLKGSIGAGVQSVLGSDRRFYILEHKISSKYHKTGENQQIIVDQIELGRASTCQVRFDESFPTVSRRHAAIVRDGDNWKLVQLSQTNSTFLNGHQVQKEWYLQNGDEIQLSVNGPKMGFITPAGKKGTVGSLGLTRRLSLFGQQALRPYKYAIAVLSILLVLSVGGLGTWSYLRGNEYERLIADAQQRLETLKGKNGELEKLMAESAKEQKRLDSLLKLKQRPIRKTVVVRGGTGTHVGTSSTGGEAANLQAYEKNIYFIQAVVMAVYNGQRIPLETSDGGYIGWTGTGFLLSDGRFVTAKHCVEGWKFDVASFLKSYVSKMKDDTHEALLLSGMAGENGVKLVSYILATSPTDEIKLLSTNFRMPTSEERTMAIDEEGKIKVRVSTGGGNDWAYARANKSGNIPGDASLSSSLPAGVKLQVLGYPLGMKADGGSCLYGSCQTSSRGLKGGVILITGNNYEHGNSGGPVFYNDNGKPKAIGIVSFGTGQHMGGIVPLCNLR